MKNITIRKAIDTLSISKGRPEHKVFDAVNISSSDLEQFRADIINSGGKVLAESETEITVRDNQGNTINLMIVGNIVFPYDVSYANQR